MITVSIIQGTDDSWNLVANTRVGPATGAATLLNTDTYSAELWLGGNGRGLLALATTWVSGSTYNVAMTKVQSAQLNFGVTYTVNAYRDRGATHNGIGLFGVLCLAAPTM